MMVLVMLNTSVVRKSWGLRMNVNSSRHFFVVPTLSKTSSGSLGPLLCCPGHDLFLAVSARDRVNQS